VDGVAVVVGVAIDVVPFAAVLRQLMNLLSEAFEVPAVLPVEEKDVPPNGMVVLVLVLFFAAKAELVRLPAVTSAIAMKMTILANASDLLFVNIKFGMQRDLL
jgi:hypothetical protein